MEKRVFSRPRLLISRCLEFEPVRYDGTMINSPFVKRLKDYSDAIPVCPEVEIGLGIPRETLRIVMDEKGDHLIQPATGKDFTEAMRSFASSFLQQIPEVDGFILKSRSPTSALRDAYIYPVAGRSAPSGKTTGIFAREIIRRWPHYPMEDEGRLRNHRIRDHFLSCIYTLSDFRGVREKGTYNALLKFHTQNKLLLGIYHQRNVSVLGSIVANPGHLSPNEIIARYGERLYPLLQRPPSISTNINILLHTLGHFSPHLFSQEKAFFLDAITQYRAGQVSLAVLKNLLKAWIIRFEDQGLGQQTYFAPYPDSLMEPDAWEDDRGRDFWAKEA